MNFVVWTCLIAFTIIAITKSSVNCVPTPSPDPQFPFTVLPPKGQGHRKPYRPPRGNYRKFDFTERLKHSFFKLTEWFWFIDGLKSIRDFFFQPKTPPIYYYYKNDGFDLGDYPSSNIYSPEANPLPFYVN